MAKKRTDAERRARQCERLSRLLRTLHLIMGPGRWDAAAIARELECSRRTVHRNLQTLSMAGVPWYYDETCQAYRVRRGFKFPGLDQAKLNPNLPEKESESPEAENLTPTVTQLVQGRASGSQNPRRNAEERHGRKHTAASVV